MRPWSCRLATLAGVSLASLLAGGCAAKQTGVEPGTSAIRVAERDFHISMPKRVPAGDVIFSVKNSGPDNHELIVIRRTKAGLPLRSDGSTLDEEGLQRAEAGTLEPGGPSSVRELKVHLEPGRYEFLCNMAGHYLGGMHREVEVR
jgi:uncharacterized cupredoxin-like copper-binding protein